MGLKLVMFLAQFKILCDSNPDALRLMLSGFRALNSIKDRHTRTGKWGANGDELKVLEDVVPAFIDLLPKINRNEFMEGDMYAKDRLTKTLLTPIDKRA